VNTRALRVAVFVGTYLPYSETFIYDQLRTHVRYRPEVYAYESCGAMQRFPFDHVHVLSGIERVRYVVLGSSTTFSAALTRTRPAVIHAHFGTNGVYAAGFARKLGVPLVVTFHGHDVPALIGRSRYTWRYARYAVFARRMLDQAALLLPASQDLADRLVRDAAADPRKVVVHRLGVDLERFSVRQRMPTEKHVVMVGRFVEKKGHVYGIRAFASVFRDHPDARLVIVGEGPLARNYQAEIDRLGIAHAVELTGVLSPEQLATRLGKARVVLAPSVTASSGDVESGLIVVKEAGAMHVPCIGTRHGGIPEIIDHQQTGYLVNERDSEAMATYLGRLLTDETLVDALGQAARTKVEREYDLNTQTARLETLFDSVLGSPEVAPASHPR